MDACAGALGTTRSLFDNDRRRVDGGGLLELLAPIRAALDLVDLPPTDDVRPRPLPELDAAVRLLTRWVQAGCRGPAPAALPGLLAELHTAAHTLTGDDQRTARQLLTEAVRYGHTTLVMFATIVGAHELLRHQPQPTLPPAWRTERVASGRGWRSLLLRYPTVGGCYGLGWLLGFGLAHLFYPGPVVVQVVVGWIVLTITWLSFRLMKSFGLRDPRGELAGFGWIGTQTGILVYVMNTLHRPWWVLVLCVVASAGLTNAYLRKREPPDEVDHVFPPMPHH